MRVALNYNSPYRFEPMEALNSDSVRDGHENEATDDIDLRVTQTLAYFYKCEFDKLPIPMFSKFRMHFDNFGRGKLNSYANELRIMGRALKN